MEVKTLEFAGFASALIALRLPYKGEAKSHPKFVAFNNAEYMDYACKINISKEDMTLLQTLRKRGDEHAKVLRGVCVWAKITAPRYWWQEACTYEVGVTKMGSTSTMHDEARGLSGEELQKVKGAITEDTENKRIQMFSYQTLSRIYAQRYNHRLPEWHTFCEWIETLPFFNELIKPIER